MTDAYTPSTTDIVGVHYLYLQAARCRPAAQSQGLLSPELPAANRQYNGIGRKIETDFDIFTTLTNSLGRLKSRFYCVRNLFLIVNSLCIGN